MVAVLKERGLGDARKHTRKSYAARQTPAVFQPPQQERPRVANDSPFPESPIKTLVWAVLQQARVDAAMLGSGENLTHTTQVTEQAVVTGRDELLDWLWCERFSTWMAVFEWSDREIDAVSQRLADVVNDDSGVNDG